WSARGTASSFHDPLGQAPRDGVDAVAGVSGAPPEQARALQRPHVRAVVDVVDALDRDAGPAAEPARLGAAPHDAGARLELQARLASRPRLALPSPLGLYDRDPVVRREAADRVRERDLAGDLALAATARELPHALDHLRQAGGGQRMAAPLEPAGGIDGQAPVERRLAVERRAAGLAGRHQAEVLERDQLERRERVVDL